MQIRMLDVKKSYGRKHALSGLSFSVEQGAICGLVGPNGAGKTTAMGVIAGLIRPDSGQVDLLGQGPFDVAHHAGRIGMMPQDAEPSRHASLQQILVYYGELMGLGLARAEDEAARVLAAVVLSDRAGSKYGTLSHGMRRRFCVAQALLGEPEVLLLDEPTSGLDPELVVEIRDLILAQRKKATVLVSSHVLSELETMCDSVVFMQDGRCTKQGSMAQVVGKATRVRFELAVQPPLEALKAALSGCELTWKEPHLLVSAAEGRSLVDVNRQVLRFLVEADIGVVAVTPGDTLEGAYLASRAAGAGPER